MPRVRRPWSKDRKGVISPSKGLEALVRLWARCNVCRREERVGVVLVCRLDSGESFYARSLSTKHPRAENSARSNATAYICALVDLEHAIAGVSV